MLSTHQDIAKIPLYSLALAAAAAALVQDTAAANARPQTLATI